MTSALKVAFSVCLWEVFFMLRYFCSLWMLSSLLLFRANVKKLERTGAMKAKTRITANKNRKKARRLNRKFHVLGLVAPLLYD